MAKEHVAQHRGRNGFVHVFGTGLFSLAFPYGNVMPPYDGYRGHLYNFLICRWTSGGKHYIIIL